MVWCFAKEVLHPLSVLHDLYICGILLGEFLGMQIFEKLRRYRKQAKLACQVYVKYRDIHSGRGVGGYHLSNKCQIICHIY